VVRVGANSLITYPNASPFSVFSHIRHFVLQNQLCSTFNSRLCTGKGDASDSEDEGGEEAGKKEEAKKMPVMVGLGVKGVFVIIQEIRHSHPELCLKTLTEFTNILCELSPAALKNEPKETTGKFALCKWDELYKYFDSRVNLSSLFYLWLNRVTLPFYVSSLAAFYPSFSCI